jgi:hypothetical protein
MATAAKQNKEHLVSLLLDLPTHLKASELH